jgi:hypothetical protein
MFLPYLYFSLAVISRYGEFSEANMINILVIYSKVKVKVKANLSLCLTNHHVLKMYWGS